MWLVAGDEGVGKSRLVRELSDRARSTGALVLTGQCVDLDGAGLPYLPFAEALGQAASDRATSRDLLRFVASRLRRERVLVVATYRSDDLHRGHPSRPLLGGLPRLPVVERIELAPFSPVELGRYLGLLRRGAAGRRPGRGRRRPSQRAGRAAVDPHRRPHRPARRAFLRHPAAGPDGERRRAPGHRPAAARGLGG